MQCKGPKMTIEPGDRNRRRVLLFVRAPELGRVKTRLERDMDGVTVLRLYQCFVKDIIETLSTGGYRLTVFFTPSHRESAVRTWLGNRLSTRAQVGKTLGDRMRNAFSDVFAREAEQAVLLGSDLPDIDTRIIDTSFEFLGKTDGVVGPAIDGGYYLIGLRKDLFNGDLFSGIDWGTASVFRQTMGQFRAAGLNAHVLEARQDIDTHDDLVAFYRRSKANGLTHLKTIKFLNQLKLQGFQ
jgi:rSAM/selenodomain-associated transferase 1